MNNFKKIYDQSHSESIDNIKRFGLGLDKLEESANKITDLKALISEEMIKVDKEKVEVEALLKVINKK